MGSENGKYHMFIWDMVDSRLCPDKDKHYVLLRTINILYQLIETIEKETEFPIIHRIERSESKTSHNPFSLFDTIGITINKDALTKEEVQELFQKAKDIAQNRYQFHCADECYETDDSKAKEGYTREECIEHLATLHKSDKEHYILKLKKAFN